ncbi:MAG: phosphoglucosamine mutase [Clostridiales bacterium]|nr:phosphoglucosamine mutase [Clostridiales bacterium]
MGKLFGTDGIRGVANVELTPELALDLGRSSIYTLHKFKNKTIRIIIGKDTRLSSYMLENALASGMCSMGAQVNLVGVIPTPAVAFLSNKFDFDIGVVISASHNVFHDNGIKFFDCKGFKLQDEIEDEIEKTILFDKKKLPRFSHDKLGSVIKKKDMQKEYIDFLLEKFKNLKLNKFRVGLDCANGATFKIAPFLFRELGAEVFVINNQPNGLNINLNCGSTNLNNLSNLVIEKKLDMAFGFDGDGDRCLAIDKNGKIIYGDSILYIFVNHLKRNNLLKNNILTTTSMSNLALFNFCKNNNINIITSKIGDKYVFKDMIESGSIVGGEQSGHIILREYSTTGDGILTALFLSKIIYETDKKLDELNDLEIMPQVTKNIIIDNKPKEDIFLDKNIKNYIFELRERLKNGRVIVRVSGTEPVVRIMLDGEDQNILEEEVKKLEELFYKFIKV